MVIPRWMPLVALSLALWWRADAHGAATAPSVDGVLTSLRTTDILSESQLFFTEAVERHKRDLNLNELQVEQLLSLGKRIYLGKNLYPAFRQAYLKAITKEDMTATFQWLSSVTGLKLRQALTVVYQTDAKKREAYFADYSAKVLRHNRKNALRSFETTWRQPELFATYQVQMDMAVLFAGGTLQQPPAKTSLKELKERLKGTNSEYDKPGREYFKVLNFYLTKELKNADIDDLTKFARSLAGAAHIKAYERALAGALEGAAATLQAQLVKKP